MFLAFDLADPPQEPPEGADVTVWTLAWLLRAEHASGDDGLCRSSRCRLIARWWPCQSFLYADASLVVAFFDTHRLLAAGPPQTGDLPALIGRPA
jgi:hypothetical protein